MKKRKLEKKEKTTKVNEQKGKKNGNMETKHVEKTKTLIGKKYNKRKYIEKYRTIFFKNTKTIIQ